MEIQMVDLKNQYLKIKTENFIEHYTEIIGIVENITSKLAF